MAQQQPPVQASANDELAVLRQRLEDETRRRQEAEQQLAALTAPKRKKKKRCILDDSDSDSDGGEDGGGAARVSVSQSPPRQLVKKRRTILEDDDLFAFRRVDPDALSRRESNAFVQKVLDAHRFGFTLLDHQYEAARCVAGLPYLWPRTLVNDRADDTVEQALLTADRHLILADQMGLGKTVTTLAGAVLRRAVAAFHSRHAPKAVLVITPNAAVMHQWSEHIDRAHGLVHVYGGGGARDGKLKARLELYEKEAARGGEVRTLVVLTTKYAVQSAAMDACNFSAPKPCALFPHLSRKDLMKLGLLKFAAADPERFLKMAEGGKLGEVGQHVADLQLEKNGKHDESSLIRDIIAAARPQRDEERQRTSGHGRRGRLAVAREKEGLVPRHERHDKERLRRALGRAREEDGHREVAERDLRQRRPARGRAGRRGRPATAWRRRAGRGGARPGRRLEAAEARAGRPRRRAGAL